MSVERFSEPPVRKGLTMEFGMRFHYNNILEETEEREIRIKEEMSPYVRQTNNKEPFVVVPAEEAFEETSLEYRRMQDILDNDACHCMKQEEIYIGDSKHILSCEADVSIVSYSNNFDGKERFRAYCSDEHLNEVEGLHADDVMDPRNEHEDRLFPPMFAVLRRES